MENNPEDIRRLEKLRVNESLRAFTTKDDVSKVQATAAAAPPAMLENLGAQLDALNLQPDQRALTEGLAMAIGTKNQRGKTLTLADAPDPLDGATLSKFERDLTKETVSGMIGLDIDPTAERQRTFATYKFPSEAAKEQTLKDLLQLLFMELQLPVTNADAMGMYEDAADANTAQGYVKARRQRQMKEVVRYMASLNTSKVSRLYQEQISESVQNEMVRNTRITSVGGRDIIPPPVLGAQSSAPPDVLRNLNTVISNTPFGSQQNSKPLSFFLETVSGVITGQYSSKGAYQLLRTVLSGAPHEQVNNSEAKGESFSSAWVDLQCSYGNYGESNEGIMSQIRQCLAKRPIDATSTVAYLRQLVIRKNRHLDASERDIVSDSEAKNVIFSFLNTWYPHHVVMIRTRFEDITNRSRANGYKCLSAPPLLTRLIAEYIKNYDAIPERRAQMHAMDCITYGSDDLSEMACTDETNRYLAREGQQAEIHAFGMNRQQQSSGFQKNRLEIPDHLKDKCLKCAMVGHFAKHCGKYPNEPVGQTVCPYCDGKHSSKCKNLMVNELQALPAPDQTFENNQGSNQGQFYYDGPSGQQ